MDRLKPSLYPPLFSLDSTFNYFYYFYLSGWECLSMWHREDGAGKQGWAPAGAGTFQRHRAYCRWVTTWCWPSPPPPLGVAKAGCSFEQVKYPNHPTDTGEWCINYMPSSALAPMGTSPIIKMLNYTVVTGWALYINGYSEWITLSIVWDFSAALR